MKDPKSLAASLKEIDQIYSQTLKKLNLLHQQKMDLIRSYLKTGDEANLKKIRQNLK